MSDPVAPPPPPDGGIPLPPSEPSGPRGLVVKGIAGSPGVAVGPALVVGDTRTVYPRRTVPVDQVPAELGRLA
jgi:phosphotransferase system enzyme I (PtsI)